MKNSISQMMNDCFVQQLPTELKRSLGSNLSPKQQALRCAHCNFCGIGAEKKDMISLLYREKRGTGGKRLGYACPECFRKIYAAMESGNQINFTCESRG